MEVKHSDQSLSLTARHSHYASALLTANIDHFICTTSRKKCTVGVKNFILMAINAHTSSRKWEVSLNLIIHAFHSINKELNVTFAWESHFNQLDSHQPSQDHWTTEPQFKLPHVLQLLMPRHQANHNLVQPHRNM